uniref:Uncharacterized protein n=1 Tax=viral metagenome TaxID=1070528 RepID=A0A6M3LD98_9ZZZZ
MSKRQVERQLCDEPGCDNEALRSACPRCGKDFCWKHEGSVERNDKRLALCAACILEILPDAELWGRASPGSDGSFPR